MQEKEKYDPAVIEAMMKVPRHFFLDPIFVQQAYSDIAFQIGAGQTISQPSTVAYQSSLLEVKKGDKVLEVGTGSGYQTCVLLALGAKVFTIERQQELFDKTSDFLPKIGYSAKFYYGDGYKGLPTYGPFDKIIVTCGAPFIPPALLTQLKPGGSMIVPVGDGKVQMMTRIVRKATDSTLPDRRSIYSRPTAEIDSFRHEDIEFTREILKSCSFVPMLADKA